MMGPTDYSNPIFGELTLKLMEGTGWYKVNFGMAEEFYWGKNAGCGMFSGQCNLNPMTCRQIGQKMCSYDYYAQGKCKQDTYVENCGIFSESSLGDCRYTGNKDKMLELSRVTHYGIGAKCIMSRITSGTKS